MGLIYYISHCFLSYGQVILKSPKLSKGDHLGTSGTVSNLRPVCQTKQSLVNNKSSLLCSKYLQPNYLYNFYSNLPSFLLKYDTKPYKWSTKWDSNSVCWTWKIVDNLYFVSVIFFPMDKITDFDDKNIFTLSLNTLNIHSYLPVGKSPEYTSHCFLSHFLISWRNIVTFFYCIGWR